MAASILTRIGHALLSMLLLSVVVFGLVRLTGNPLSLLLPETAMQEDYDRLAAKLGLDKPLWQQYGVFLSNVLQGDLGTSFHMRVGVSELIGQRLPVTLQLAGFALLIVLGVGLPLGIYSAYWRGGWLDRSARAFAALGTAAPSFWVGLLLILTFAVHFRVLPAGGYGGFDHMLLPGVTMAWAAAAGVTRLMRSSMIEVLNSDYVRFLRIKGVPEREILWKHALRNAGISTLTFIGVVTARLITGSVIAETVFTWPGMGQLMIQAIGGRDFQVIQSVVLVFSLVFISANLIVDLLYAVLNPRLR